MGRYLKNTEIRHAGQYSVRVPFGETGTRPENPITGQLRYNTTLDVLEIYANNAWQFFAMVGPVDIVKDVFEGDGANVSFSSMSYTYDAGEEQQVLVFIGSVHQNPNVAYTFNSTDTITFTSAPPNLQSIVILHNYASTRYSGAV